MFHMRLIEPVGIAKLRADGYFYNQRILVNRASTNLLSPYPSAGGPEDYTLILLPLISSAAFKN